MHQLLPQLVSNLIHVQRNASVILGYPYGPKAYKAFYFESQTLFTSRDVIFHENIFLFQTQGSGPSPLVLPCPISDHEDTNQLNSSSILLHLPLSSLILLINQTLNQIHDILLALGKSPTTFKITIVSWPFPLILLHWRPLTGLQVKSSHPLSHFLSYDNLSPSHRVFFVTISSIKET